MDADGRHGHTATPARDGPEVRGTTGKAAAGLDWDNCVYAAHVLLRATVARDT